MSMEVEVTDELLASFHQNTILLSYNNPAPSEGRYGWLKSGQRLRFRHSITIEQNCGLYGGPYAPFVGGHPSCGLCTMGSFSYSYSPLPDGLIVGRYCSISTGLKFIDSHHPIQSLTTSAFLFRPSNNLFKEYITPSIRAFASSFSTAGEKKYPVIAHDVWIGANCTLGLGISIGSGAIIAANSTVTGDVPPYAIVGGNPAKIIRFRFDFETIAKLIASQWWTHDPKTIFSGETLNPEDVLRSIGDASPAFHPWSVTL
ncbi:acetyltransferase-like isoleucine patch superfamily enzyme [Pseudoxanthomonas japonensis]|nr:acetyltransferase-like isoleucine patch superfamily enzyme [Pseudoxanthomonas japonensis]